MSNLQQKSIEIPLFALVRIFEEEAEAVCDSAQEARVLAAEALSDFLLQYSNNAIVD